MIETNENYDRRIAAATFIRDAPKGSFFECFRGVDRWQRCSPADAFGCLHTQTASVRIQPIPQKVLRPAWEIFKIATEKDLIDGNGHINYTEHSKISFKDLHCLIGMTLTECKYITSYNVDCWPSWFFTDATDE